TTLLCTVVPDTFFVLSRSSACAGWLAEIKTAAVATTRDMRPVVCCFIRRSPCFDTSGSPRRSVRFGEALPEVGLRVVYHLRPLPGLQSQRARPLVGPQRVELPLEEVLRMTRDEDVRIQRAQRLVGVERILRARVVLRVARDRSRRSAEDDLIRPSVLLRVDEVRGGAEGVPGRPDNLDRGSAEGDVIAALEHAADLDRLLTPRL